MGRLVGNEYVSLNLTGRSWEEDTLELALIPGTYRIITTNRLPNGNQFAWEKTFTIKEGGQQRRNLASPRSSAWRYAGAYFPSGV